MLKIWRKWGLWRGRKATEGYGYTWVVSAGGVRLVAKVRCISMPPPPSVFGDLSRYKKSSVLFAGELSTAEKSSVPRTGLIFVCCFLGTRPQQLLRNLSGNSKSSLRVPTTDYSRKLPMFFLSLSQASRSFSGKSPPGSRQKS